MKIYPVVKFFLPIASYLRFILFTQSNLTSNLHNRHPEMTLKPL